MSADSSRRSGAKADRDRILEQALTHELKAAGAASAGACLDADMLGAWTDGALDPTAVAACEAHVSSCARCQSLVSAMSRAASATGQSDASAARAPFSWKWLLAPLAAGATAATIWMVVPEQQQSAVAPPHMQGGVPGGAATIPPAQPEARPQARSAPIDQLAQRDAAAAAPRLDQQSQQLQSFEDKRTQDARREQAAVTESRAREVDVAPAPAAPAAAADAALGAVAQSAPPPPAMARLEKSARPAAAAIEVPTLDPSRRWRIAADRIERTEDGGRTWAAKRETRADISAGSAPSNTAAWFVGRAGLVLVTADAGDTFTDVSLAEPLDIASVSAADARTASIYTVSGRRFRTEDGGRTWRPF